MDLGLRGRLAVVGGASAGLGRASASALAAEGCNLLIWSRNAERLEATAGELRGRSGGRVPFSPFARRCLGMKYWDPA